MARCARGLLLLGSVSCMSAENGVRVPRPLPLAAHIMRDPTGVPPPSLRSTRASLQSWQLLRGGMTTRTGWLILFRATAFELLSTAMMHKAQGFSRPLPSFLAVLFYGASFYSFNLSLRALELSVAYAVWSAVVMATLSLVGIVLFNEKATLTKAFGIGAIMFGTICLSRDMSE
ncbi:hypothetical protein AB1Y20_019517 [Prymnesium parvum]|uniref:EamA domain-containing protein n=1 Tax=Prymnesium parvum TaxID=97485 RepID=A0AB34JSR6_PRYPA